MAMSLFVIAGQGRPSFPIGSNALFGVTLHDNVGRKFDTSSVAIKHRTSRFDIVFTSFLLYTVRVSHILYFGCFYFTV